VNCKHFIASGLDNSFGKCNLFPKEPLSSDYLVTGIEAKESDIEYRYCSVARKYDDMCGEKGELFEQKKRKYMFHIFLKK
jgi:hypothetical protein